MNPDAPVLRRLLPRDEDAVATFLDQQPERDIYLRGLIWRLGTRLPDTVGSLYGWYRDGALTGVFLHSPSVVLSCEDPEGVARFAKFLASVWPRQPAAELLAPRHMVESLLGELRALIQLPPPRLYRREMPLLRATWDDLRAPSARSGGSADLRQATAADLAVLRPLCRAMTLEELGIDPALDGTAYDELLARRVQAGREYVWTEGDRAVFRAAVSAATPEAVLIEGVYTPPSERGRGRALLGMYALAQRLLRYHQRVVLFVDSSNLPALRLYDRLGFRTSGEYQALYWDAAAWSGESARPWARGSTPGLRVVP